jgi:hypothetical protein
VFVAVQKSRKFEKRKKFEKCWILLQLPLDASMLANTLLVNLLLFTAGLLKLKSQRKQAENHRVASGIHRLRSVRLRLLNGTFGLRTLA